ncbi:amidohydrolase [Phnomibacter ginsenosidimutans]|uniref:Amidohydrolase n=1 Tax=Phnomibacter ginsenosidimutans TaxID=2676868 RepID=A0A6I6GIA9_9BACT|nr:amidohydrolase [Phnomibacter ginsenosidimutans]QGW28145.1 amidohydrolase [Phnomibacter ginsenosidimutans]
MRKTMTASLLVLSTAAMAQPNAATINSGAAALQPKLVEWRRHLHQHPELGNREVQTATYIAAHLKALGIEVREKVGVTGVVGILRGGKPGPVVALRADMDALPVKERVDLPFKSTVTAEYLGQTVPVMHACGHDTHVSILMGTAQLLANMKKDVPGTVVFIFQPAEEGPPGNEEGGAPLMIKEGALDNPKVDAIFGLHINSQTPIGQIKYKPEGTMASSDWFTIKVKGKQTHGSQPWSGVDPIMVSAAIIDGLQTIVSREMELTKAPVVISVGKINSGVRSNIIPEEATMEGTIRTLEPNMQKQLHERMKKLVTTIAEAHGATAEINIDTKTLVTYNNPELTAMMVPSLVKAAGEGNVKLTEWTTGAEDFSYFSDKVPGIFFFLGGMPAGKNPKEAAPHHTPDFYIDDSMLDVGVKAFANLVFDYAALKAPATKKK